MICFQLTRSFKSSIQFSYLKSDVNIYTYLSNDDVVLAFTYSTICRLYTFHKEFLFNFPVTLLYLKCY